MTGISSNGAKSRCSALLISGMLLGTTTTRLFGSFPTDGAGVICPEDIDAAVAASRKAPGVAYGRRWVGEPLMSIGLMLGPGELAVEP